MTRNINFVATGGTITCATNKHGFLEPLLEAKALKDLAIIAGFEDKETAIQNYNLYKIDSQIFDLDAHGQLMIKMLSQIPLDQDQDIVITTGTDTINWLAALIRNHEAKTGFKRKVVILSSMHAPIEDSSKTYVGKIIRAGLEMVENSGVENGVYVSSAQNEDASEIKFFDVSSPGAEITKFPQGESAIIVGNMWYKSPISQIDSDTRTRFKRYSSSSSSSSSDDTQLPAELVRGGDFDQFILNCKMRRLPVLSKTPAKISAKYLDGVSFGDVVALEVGESWFFDQEIKKEYFELVKDLSEKGVKIILNNRSIFNGEFFEKELSAEKFSQITSFFTSLFKGENILPINNIPTDSIYAKLGMLSEESGEILPCAKELQSQLGQLGPLGLRYIPSINLFRCGLGMIRDQLPKNTVLEGLVGGVVPIHLLDNLQDQKSGTIFSCGSYKVGALDNSYASSAASDLLDQKNIKRETTSASEMMDILNEKNLPEKTTTKKTAKFSASNFSQNAACVIL